MADDVLARIETLVKSDKVVLFMKGTRGAPQCGFSATVVQILDQYVPDYTTVNVLADPEIRDGVKEYASWPTIPQLYVEGEFVGGCDIIREMDAQGELLPALGDAASEPTPPEVTITDAAAAIFAQAQQEAEDGEHLRLVIDMSFRHDLALSAEAPSDVTVTANAITLIMDRGTARRAQGLVIDYVEQPQAGFKMDNPNAPPVVRQISAAEAKAMVEEDANARFVDVRTPQERATAMIEGTTLLTPETMDELMALPKDTPLVFHCHHGQRSHQAALHFLDQGFTRVHNVIGGIDAWSAEVDASVPRY
jgi:monothiol glutaredoxin